MIEIEIEIEIENGWEWIGGLVLWLFWDIRVQLSYFFGWLGNRGLDDKFFKLL